MRRLRDASFIGMITTCSRPYSLDDLFSSYLKIGYHSRKCSLWLDWLLLHHPLYREDHLSVTFGRPLLIDGFYLKVEPCIERRAVRGFPAESSRALSLAAGYAGTGPMDFGVEGFLGGSAHAESRAARIRVSLHLDSFDLVLNRVVHGAHEGDLRIGAEIGICSGLSIVSGYRVRTDEVSGGLFYNRRLLLIGISWSHHPVLGRTLSLGVGRLWSR